MERISIPPICIIYSSIFSIMFSFLKYSKPCSIIAFYLLLFGTTVLSGLISCHEPSRLDVDISKINYTPKIYRFEKDLFDLDSTFPHKEYKNLEKKYPEFYPLFITRVAGLGEDSGTYIPNLRAFIHNKDLRKLKSDCDSVYPNLNSFLPGLGSGFRHFIYYFPTYPLPQFTTFLSGFNSAIVNSDSSLGIGLDMFLGKNYPIYNSVQFPKYLTRTLNADYIPVTALKGFGKQVFPPKKENSRILDQMIYEGKILYFLDAMFPNSPDSIKISYSGTQLAWCREHEAEIWSSVLQGDKIFRSDKADFDTYFSTGPFTPGLSPESAPRLGEWLGWQIVRKYMNEEKKVGLPDLMKDQDSEKILRLSHYRP